MMYDIQRQVFFSFYYNEDVCLTAQVRSMGVVTGRKLFSDNDWETVEKTDASIIRWIDKQLQMRSCTIVLIGEHTWQRKWVRYEIQRSWELGKGVFGMYIHGLKDFNGNTRFKGNNPFSGISLKNCFFGASILEDRDPTCIWGDLNLTYQNIQNQIQGWIEAAIQQRKQYPL